jgi:hypothetical protein
LVGIGRTPNVENLNLEAVGVKYSCGSGVKVNDFLQTTNSRIYAAGDVCLEHKFMHFEPSILVRRRPYMGLLAGVCSLIICSDPALL